MSTPTNPPERPDSTHPRQVPQATRIPTVAPARGHLLIAEQHAMSGRLATALVHARRAVELKPGYFMLGDKRASEAYRERWTSIPGMRKPHRICEEREPSTSRDRLENAWLLRVS